jgi:outer membrane protein TolC
MMKIGILIRLILGLVFVTTSYSQTITLEDFLALVRQNHPFFEKEALSSEIEMKLQERFLGDEDWVVSSSPFYRFQKPISAIAFTPKSIHSVGLGLVAERVIWKTGGRLSLSWSSDFTKQKTSDIVIPGIVTIPSGPSTFYQHGIFASYSHPLIQNKGGKLDRLEYELAEYSVKSTDINSLENQEAFLLGLGIGYLEWVLLSEQIQIAKERLGLAEEQLRQTQKRRAANLVDQVDVIRAEDAIRISKQNIVLLESRWKAKQAELATLARSDQIYSQTPEHNLYLLETLPAIDEVVSSLQKRSRSLLALNTLQEQLTYQREGLEEASFPRLNLNVSAGLQEGDDDVGGSLLLHKPDFLLGLQFSYPLGNRTARADVEKADLQIRQLADEVHTVRLDLEAAARNLLIQINDMEKVLALNQEQIESARQKTEEEVRLYNQGRSQLTFVIQSRDNEENSKLIYAQNAAFYHQLILQYRALMDELLREGRES